jgi:hypothetical protein
LILVTDTETLRIGRMSPVAKDTPGTWDTKIEILEAKMPYAVFKKMAMAQSVEIQVGRDAVELREKNIAALKDLNTRVITPSSTSSN